MYIKLFEFLFTLLISIFIIFTSILLSINNLYIHYEYSNPSFPVDEFGWTTSERIMYAENGIKYIKDRRSPEYASEILLNDGIYDSKEINHLIDLKIYTDLIYDIQLFITIIFLVLSLIYLKQGLTLRLLRIIKNSSKLSGIVTLFLFLFVIIGWSNFFELFHVVLFKPETWLFSSNSALIRLYPEKFWFDYAIYVGFLFGILSIILFIGASISSKMLRNNKLNSINVSRDSTKNQT